MCCKLKTCEYIVFLQHLFNYVPLALILDEGDLLARLLFSFVSSHEMSFFYLGTVEPRKRDKALG